LYVNVLTVYMAVVGKPEEIRPLKKPTIGWKII
jgi:hypothetical protein